MKMGKKRWVAAVVIVAAMVVGCLSSLQFVQAQTPVIAADDAGGIIPQDAVRLRIIANSDNPKDQQLKEHVRDQIIVAVGQKLVGVNDPKRARAIIQASVPEMNKIAAQVIKKEGYSYPVKTDFGQVPFPTKLYGDKVYPAGNYEALRIRIGQAAGQNWWCVLFPPLCFVDMANADASPKIVPRDMPQTAPLTTISVKNANTGQPQQVEVRFALFDRIDEWFHSLFA